MISHFPPQGRVFQIPQGFDELKYRLIYTAMHMSLSNIIGYAAAKPPSSELKQFAAEYGFRILYLPMIQLSKASMNRLRTLHLLADKSLRDDANEYIGF